MYPSAPKPSGNLKLNRKHSALVRKTLVVQISVFKKDFLIQVRSFTEKPGEWCEGESTWLEHMA